MTTGMIFVGGPGRSGTSFVADRVGRHQQVATFQDVELKIFGEFGGLRDMQSVLVESFSPNRAEIITKHFRRMLTAVFCGGFGQPALQGLVPLDRLNALADTFFAQLQPSGYIERLDYAAFNEAARELIHGLAMIALEQKPGATAFLEKTPHNCLQPQFLHELAPQARYLHIYRNPKAIAVSLLNQNWGPDKMAHAIVWVRSYFQAWIEAKTCFARFGLPLLDLRIEDITTNPKAMSDTITTHLQLQADSDMLAGGDLERLNGWKTKLSSEDHTLLDRELDPLCSVLGY